MFEILWDAPDLENQAKLRYRRQRTRVTILTRDRQFATKNKNYPPRKPQTAQTNKGSSEIENELVLTWKDKRV